jgi:hypothetical protein
MPSQCPPEASASVNAISALRSQAAEALVPTGPDTPVPPSPQ